MMSDPKLTPAQRKYLQRGIDQPGGKLPLFDEQGQRVAAATIQACLEHGWAEPWFANPVKPDWLVCKLTDKGREALGQPAGRPVASNVIHLNSGTGTRRGDT